MSIVLEAVHDTSIVLEAVHDTSIVLEAVVDTFTVSVPGGLPVTEGLVTWFDFSQIDTLHDAPGGGTESSDDDAILYVTDLSGSGNHATRPTGNGPLRRDGEQNGLTVLEFVSANTTVLSLPLAAITPFNGDSQPCTFFAVVRRDSVAIGMIIGMSALADNANFRILYSHPSNYYAMNAQAPGVAATGRSDSIRLNEYVIVVGRYDGSKAECWQNGISAFVDFDVIGMSTMDTGYVGANESGGSEVSHFNGFMGEIITYNANLSNAEIDQVAGDYLAPKWNIAWANLIPE